jgi:hypothetical protein
MVKELALTIALIAGAHAARAQTPPEKTAMPNGLIVETRLAIGAPISVVGAPISGAGGANVVTNIQPIPQIVIGGRLADRLHLGLGFAFQRIAVDTPGMVTSTFNLFYFTPTVEVDIVRSRDHRVAFYGKAGLPLGVDIISTSGAPSSNGFVVGYDVAVGMRYAFHPAFTLGFEAGLDGFFVNPERNTDDAFATTFYSALVGTFFFGGR